MGKQLTDEQWETWRNMTLPVGVPKNADDLRHFMESYLRHYVFTSNSHITRSKIVDDIDGIIEPMIQGSYIADAKIVCDDTNNTPSNINNGELNVDMYIRPTRTINMIHIPIKIKRL